MTQANSLYLADDHQIIIDGLKLLISDETCMQIVGWATDGDTACKEILAKKPDVALIDLSMPNSMSGLDIIRKLARVLPDTRFVVLSMHDRPRDIRDAMTHGAAGYLIKNTGKSELMKCLTAVLRGETHFPKLAAPASPVGKPLFTPRETEILKLILSQHTTTEIAEQLHLSPHTVLQHRKNIGHKTKTNTVLGLVQFLQDNGIEL